MVGRNLNEGAVRSHVEEQIIDEGAVEQRSSFCPYKYDLGLRRRIHQSAEADAVRHVFQGLSACFWGFVLVDFSFPLAIQMPLIFLKALVSLLQGLNRLP